MRASGPDCAEARECLWPTDRPRLVDAQVRAAREHMAACEHCRAFVRDSRALGSAFQALAGRPVPEDLAARVRASLLDHSAAYAPRTSRKHHRGWRRPSALAGGVLAVLAATAWLVAVRTDSPPVALATEDASDATAFVDDYLRQAVAQQRIQSSDLSTVRSWLMGELGLSMKPIRHAGLQLTGAEICLLRGRLGAMIHYELDGMPVAHYLLPAQGAEPRAPALAAAERTHGMETPLVTWASRSVEQALVGEVDPEHLLAMARTVY